MNACGQYTVATGTYQCDGSCSAVAPTAPSNPSLYGEACTVTSAPNICGHTASTVGIYQCDGSCSASLPVVPVAADSDHDGVADCIETPDIVVTKSVNISTAMI